MFKKIISLILLLSVFTGVFLIACNRNPPEAEGFEYGFKQSRGTGRGSEFFSGAKSEKTVFDIDAVEIDFYFGWGKMHPSQVPKESVGDYFERVCIAAYFYDNDNGVNVSEEFDDYRKIDGFYLIKEFEWEEFMTESYSALYTPNLFNIGGTTEFRYNELFTIPQEMFSKETGTIGFGLTQIWKSKESGNYLFLDGFGSRDDVWLYYQKINDLQVKIGY